MKTLKSITQHLQKAGLTILLSMSCLLLHAQNTWIQKSNIGAGGTSYASGFSIGTKVYIGTGDQSIGFSQGFWEWDQGSNIWTQKANFGGTGRSAAVGFAIGTKGYLGTGRNSSSVFQDFWEYDPATNIWTPKSSFPGQPRIGAVGIAIGIKGYVGTGSNIGGSSVFYQDFWEYNSITDIWSQIANFGGAARYGAVGFAIGSKGYVGTGSDYNLMADFWEYDPATNVWTQKFNYGNNGITWAVGFNIGSKGYIGTGIDSTGITNHVDFWEYNPLLNTWTSKANFGGIARNGAFGCSIGNKGYIGSGWNSPTTLQDFWEYTPDTLAAMNPIVNLNSSDTSFCDKHCIDFFDLSTNNPTSWQWFFPGSDSLTSTLQNPTNICYSTYGSFDVILIACNAAGCDTLILSGFINEYPMPTATITQSNDTLFSSPGVSYQWWSTDSGLIALATNSFFVPTQAGNYYVMVSDSIGCSGTSNVITITGLSQISNNHFPISITPNPAKDIITITATSFINPSLSIYDLTGKILLEKQFDKSIEINVDALSGGIYFVRVSDETGRSANKKLVKF